MLCCTLSYLRGYSCRPIKKGVRDGGGLTSCLEISTCHLTETMRSQLEIASKTKQARACMCAGTKSASLVQLCAAPVHDAAHEEEPGRLGGQETRGKPGQNVHAQAVRCLPARTQHISLHKDPICLLEQTQGLAPGKKACPAASTSCSLDKTDAATPTS